MGEEEITWSLEVRNINWALRLWIVLQVILWGKFRLNSDTALGVPDVEMNPHHRENL